MTTFDKDNLIDVISMSIEVASIETQKLMSNNLEKEIELLDYLTKIITLDIAKIKGGDNK